MEKKCPHGSIGLYYDKEKGLSRCGECGKIAPIELLDKEREEAKVSCVYCGGSTFNYVEISTAGEVLGYAHSSCAVYERCLGGSTRATMRNSSWEVFPPPRRSK